MAKSILAFLLALNMLFLPGCRISDSEGEARDYMPFSNGGYLYHWSKGDTIRIYLPKNSATDRLKMRGYQEYYRTAFIEGIKKWGPTLSELGIKWNTVGTIGDNDIQVIWSDRKDHKIPITVLGSAEIEIGQSISRKITMTTKRNGVRYSYREIVAIAAHEFGHMLGIWSHSFEAADLMYPFLSKIEDPSNRDKETMKYLYSLPPDINLSNLPANSFPVPENNDVRHMVRALCGHDPQAHGYQEFYSKIPTGISPRNSGLK